MAQKRGPMQRWVNGKRRVHLSDTWPVWRVVRAESYGEDDPDHWIAAAPGTVDDGIDSDRWFPTHAEALAYALSQIESERHER